MNSSVPMIKVGDLVEQGVADIQTGPFGTQLKASEYVDTGVPVINVRNVGFGDVRDADLEFITPVKAEKLAAHQLEEGDIVFGRKGAVERHAMIGPAQTGWVQGSDCLRLRLFSDSVCERYVSYYFRTQAHQDWMHALCSFGATMASLNQDIVKRISIPLPDYAIQRKIAAILTAYDDLIETNKRRIALLEKMAEEIYREWFVRMRFPGHEKSKFVKGVPDGWVYVAIETFAKFKYGHTESAVFDDGLPKFLRVTDINKSSYVDWGNVPNCSISDVELEKLKLSRYDIVIARMADPGQVAIVEEDLSAVFASYLIKIAYERSEIAPYYLFYTLRMNAYLEFFRGANSGATRGSINAGLIGKTKILKPSRRLQAGFDLKVGPLRSQISALLSSNRTLAQARDLLLPRLISGKLSVENLDIQFPPGMQ